MGLADTAIVFEIRERWSKIRVYVFAAFYAFVGSLNLVYLLSGTGLDYMHASASIALFVCLWYLY